MNRKMRYVVCSIACLAVGLVALALCVTPGPAHAAPPFLPPRPTASPSPEPPSPPKTEPGALIILEATFDDSWAASGLAWQELWTVVQWRDAAGRWRDVEGWQGALDKVAGGVGWKIWWLPQDLSGAGPFRWVVYRSRGGATLATSQTFDLPFPSPWGLVIPVDIAP